MDKTRDALVTMLTCADAGICAHETGQDGVADRGEGGIPHSIEPDGSVVLSFDSGRRIRVRFEEV